MRRGPKKKAQSPAHSWVGLGWALGFVGFAEAYYPLAGILCSRTSRPICCPEGSAIHNLSRRSGLLTTQRRDLERKVQHIQVRWSQREQVEESSDLHQGWVRKAGANPPKGFSKDDQTKLQQEVLKGLGLI